MILRNISAPLIHRYKLAKPLLDLIRIGHIVDEDGNKLCKKKYKKPEDLTIVMCHNYTETPLFEESLQLHGINDYVVLGQDRKEWYNLIKIRLVREYLLRRLCQTKYLLHCDAKDVILWEDPQRIVDIFESTGLDLMFMSTSYTGGYVCMPTVREWTESIYNKRYINSGVYIGKPDFMLKVLTEASEYCATEPELSLNRYRRLRKRGTELCKRCPQFPYGSPDDQDIFRFIHQQYYPEMGIDTKNEIAYRNP